MLSHTRPFSPVHATASRQPLLRCRGVSRACTPANAQQQQQQQETSSSSRHSSSTDGAADSSSSSSSSRPRDVRARGSSRRQLLLGSGAAGLVLTTASWVVGPQRPALAFMATPEGYRAQIDKLDGYSFVYPEQWAAVTSSGNDIFLRNPFNVEQNMFVDISSPSSSRYASVADLGSPDDAARKLLDRYLNREFMSTRLGVKREGRVVDARRREKDGRVYYDVEVRMTSYANRNPYDAADRGEAKAEWDRLLLTTLGVANSRLYQLRLQTDAASYERERGQVDSIRQSFSVFTVEEPKQT